MKKYLEPLKEIGRLILSAVIGYLLTEGVIDLLVELAFKESLDVPTKIMITTLIGSIVRVVDRYVHVTPSIKSSGILPF